MNQPTQVIATLEHYKVAIRDTLEYTLNKEAYNLDAYKEKKRSVLIEVEQPTPLKSIINASGENGEKLEKMIRDFYDDVYGDESTILKLADDGLRVDHAQHIAIFKGVVPIHENVEAMVSGIIRDAKSKNIDVRQAELADLAEERLYRGVCYLTMVGQLVRLFNDYNVARREAKGEESAASKFIGNDISEVITLLNTVRANNRLTDERYKKFKRVHRFNGSVNTTCYIYHGEISKRVYLLQEYLNWYSDGKFFKECGPADGIYGDNTFKWCCRFQEEQIGKGEGDGIVGPKTIAAMEKVVK